jgi:hypothetical protein
MVEVFGDLNTLRNPVGQPFGSEFRRAASFSEARALNATPKWHFGTNFLQFERNSIVLVRNSNSYCDLVAPHRATPCLKFAPVILSTDRPTTSSGAILSLTVVKLSGAGREALLGSVR